MTVVDKLVDPMVPDFANPPKVRIKRAPKHDFKDGKGRVFAHRHDNGGGWVADTAWVAPTANVTRNAQVYDFARVHDRCRVSGRGHVCGRSKMFDRAHVDQHAKLGGDAILFDDGVLNGFARVSGNAKVFGSSRVSRNTEISQNAIIVNTNIVGPEAYFWARIYGNARLFNCRCNGYLGISGTTVAENSELTNVLADGNARIVNSYITTFVPNEYHARQTNTNIELPGPVEATLISIMGLFINSHVNTPRWVLHNGTTFLNTRMYCVVFDDTVSAALDSLVTRSIVDFVLRSPADIHNMVQRVLNPNTAPAPTSRGPILARPEPNLEAVRQRRIMRMERT
jgi:hypothetical protein